MKQLISLAIVIAIIASCTHKKDAPVIEEKNTNSTFILDSLLRYNSETDLITAFGRENVGRDTAWYPEGMGQYMITTLYPHTSNEVEFVWNDSAAYTGLNYVRVYEDSSTWSTHGVKIGTTLNELIQLNGKDFTFSGFGWDYGGQLMWSEGGNLSDVDVTLDAANNEMPQSEQDSLLGEQTISSKSAIARKHNPIVTAISLAPKKKE